MRIGICAPANPLDPAVAEAVTALVARDYPGVALVVHPQCFRTDAGHFAGPDAARAAAFLDLANDPTVDAVWFARGGYGSNRILAEVIPALNRAANTKTYLGYSDTGFLLAALYTAGVGRPAHGPMPSDIARPGSEAAVRRALDWLTRGDPAACEPSLDDRPAVAFTLAILAALVGTDHLSDLGGHIVHIEEVGEPLYRIDRMLFQLAHATQLRGIAGIRLGRISAVVPNEPVWGETIETMITRWCAEMGVPYLGRSDIGHDADNTVVPFGPR